MTTRIIKELNLCKENSKKKEKVLPRIVQKQKEKHLEGKYKIKQEQIVNDFRIEEDEIKEILNKPKIKKEDLNRKISAIQSLICNITI